MEHAKAFNLQLVKILDFLTKIVPKKNEADLAYLAQGAETLNRLDATLMIEKFINGGFIERFGKAIIARDESVLQTINAEEEIKRREQTRGLKVERRNEMIELINILKVTLPTLHATTKDKIWVALEEMYINYIEYIKVKKQLEK